MLKIKSSSFFNSFADFKKIPNTFFPEIAMVGRSNVGKSSIINDLTGSRIAKVSSEPGKTRLINYYLINNSFYIVDLPGYGYAKASKEIKKNWPELIANYLELREQLKIIIFILDIRRTPNEHDLYLNSFFKANDDLKVFYILSKIDKLSSNEKNNQIRIITKELDISKEEIINYSTTLKVGKIELLKKIEPFIK